MLGWRLDADVSGDEYRLVQFTPPGSACSILSNQSADLGVKQSPVSAGI
jgi:hypothetical protein